MVAKKARIVIIGAGMAGLTAANKLYTSSPELFDLCVVEAGDRIGGRIRSSEFSGVRIETGATWIHGIGGSPVYDIACKIQALDSTQPWERMDVLPADPVSVAEGGLRVDPSLSGPISSLYRGLMDFAKSDAAPPIAAAAKDPSVGSFLRRGLQAYRESRSVCSRALGGGWEVQSLEDAAFAMHENTERTYTSADDLAHLDLAAEREYREFPGEEITIAKGYSRIIEHLASPLPPELILMGKKVERIEWRPDGSPPNDLGDPPVRLHFEDHSIVDADHVIVTVSLGVLKADARKDSGLFSPSLPSFKKEAIGRLGFGVVNKLFMEYDCSGESPFPYLQLLFDQDPLSQRRVASVPQWIRRTAYIRPVYGDSHVLVAWFAGKEALELESLKDDETLRGVQATLEGFSPGENRPRSSYGKITKVMKSGWGRNPLFLGSYSYVAVGSSGEDLDSMAEPLPRTTGGGDAPLQILFAGEATHRTHYSTTHGAYLSGIREAHRLLQHYGR